MGQIKKALFATWESPQNALGAAVKKFSNASLYTTYNGASVYTWNKPSGLSLGKYIFIPSQKNYKLSGDTLQQFIQHEYGHTVQSKLLGWFYLLVIGLPSIIWCTCFEQYRKRTGISYYSFYTERWADILGGVER